MRRFGLLLLLLLLGAGGAQADERWQERWQQRWSSLWRNADQRGERLLRQGDAAAAARTYADPRRRAYAELQAGNYPAAARDFAAFDDGDAHYNRGNALARAGDLAGALQAYDAALARDPEHRDARHNRDLVARALRQPPPPGQARSGKQRGEEGKSAKQGQSSGRDEKGAQGNAASDRAGQGDKPGQDGRDAKPGDQGRAGAWDGRGNHGNAASAAQAAKPGNGESRNSPGNDADQARRDAEAGLGREAEKNAGDGNARDGNVAAGRGRAEAPRSERQLAQEQWLRQVPDDPGGLLRRKFLIEHLMRQQGNPP